MSARAQRVDIVGHIARRLRSPSGMTDVNAAYRALERRRTALPRGVERDLLAIELADLGVETSCAPAGCLNSGNMQSLVARYAAPHEAPVRILARMALANLLSYNKGRFDGAIGQIDIALRECRLHACEVTPALRRELLTRKAFLHVYRHDHGRATRLFNRLRVAEATRPLDTALYDVGTGYAALLRCVAGGRRHSHAARAWALLKRGRAVFLERGCTSFVAHIDLYAAILRLKTGRHEPALELFEALCGERVTYPAARLFAPLGAALCTAALGDHARAESYRARYHEEKRAWARRPEFHRTPELFSLYCDAVVIPSTGMPFERKENLVRRAAQPYQQVHARLDGHPLRCTLLADVLNATYARLVALYLAHPEEPPGWRRLAHALFAIDKSRYPLLRYPRTGARPPGAVRLIDEMRRGGGEDALVALGRCAGATRAPVWYCFPAAARRGFLECPWGPDPQASFGEILGMLGGRPRRLFVLAGRDLVALPLHQWTASHFGAPVPVCHAVNLERLSLRWPVSLHASTPVQLHLPGPYRTRLGFDHGRIRAMVRRVFGAARLFETTGALDERALLDAPRGSPLIVVGHGRDDGARIDMGSSLVDPDTVRRLPAAAIEQRAVLFLCCRAATSRATENAGLVNVPAMFLYRGAAWCLASLRDVGIGDESEAAVGAFRDLIRGAAPRLSAPWRLMV